MPYHYPFEVLGFHSCDKEVGIAILNGELDLKPSNNSWDWLADGIYFWEQNPFRALDYATKSAEGSQFNKKRITTPFVLGAILELGNCLNLVAPEATSLLTETYEELEKIYQAAGEVMPKNEGAKRELDCAIIKAVHQANIVKGKQAYDSVRCAFNEGVEAYPNSNFTTQLHIQISIRTPELIKGYFLPRPSENYNPYLQRGFIK